MKRAQEYRMQFERRRFLKMMAAAGLTLPARMPLRAGDEPVKLDFWDMRNGPEATFVKAGEDLAARYNASHPGVQVSYESQEWTDWPQLFYIAVSSGTAPDLSTGGSFQAMQYYDRGEIAVLDDVVADLKRSGEDRDFLPGTLDYMVHDGHTIALPWAIDVRVIYYRKDLFAKAGIQPPRSWDELRAAARAITSKGQYGCVMAGAALLGMHALFVLILNNGGGLFSSDGRVDMMTDRNLEAFTFLSNMVKDGSVNPACWKFSSTDAEQAFLTTGGAILFDSPGLQVAFPDQLDKIGLLSPPAGLHGDKGTISWIPNVMLYKQGKHPEQAKAFLKWWLANDKPMWTEGRCSRLPVRSSFAADPYFQSDPIVKKVIEEWVPVGKSLGEHKKGAFSSLNQLEGYGPMNVLLRDLLTGKDPTESAALADARLKTLLESPANK